MTHQTLLLSASYEVVSFITERKAIKMLFNDKVEVVSSWDNSCDWVNGSMKLPSILRLKNHIKRNYFNYGFTRQAMVKRDRSTCQFCGKKLVPSQITVDHVKPRAQGGCTSFSNCVVACYECNFKKANRTPEEAGMKLLKTPTHPSFAAQHFISNDKEFWNEEWDNFL